MASLAATPPHNERAEQDRADARTFSEKVRAGAKELGPAGPLALAATLFPPLGGFLLLGTLNIVGPYLAERGAAGVALYVTGFILLAGLALLPTYAQAILGGWAFGVAVGAPAALGGFLGGSIIGYVIARRVAGARVMEILDRRPRWLVVRDSLVGGGFWKTLLIVALVRVPPNSPFAITNLVLGSTRVAFAPYALGTLIGMTPRTVAAVYIASGFRELMFDEAREQMDATKKWVIVAGVATMLAVVIVLGKIANRALARLTGAGVGGAPGEGPTAGE